MAMQLDINPFWVRSFIYGRDAQGQLVAYALDPSMPGNGMEYLYGYAARLLLCDAHGNLNDNAALNHAASYAGL